MAQLAPPMFLEGIASASPALCEKVRDKLDSQDLPVPEIVAIMEKATREHMEAADIKDRQQTLFRLHRP